MQQTADVNIIELYVGLNRMAYVEVKFGNMTASY